ncbi:hypothetical protein AAUPMC_03914, partial [Pasteurella multocida subsp. multocida str. Anand1_cattle]
LFSYLLYLFYPQYFAEPDLNSISYIGALDSGFRGNYIRYWAQIY